MLPEILLFGEAKSGKDTVADFLVKNHGAVGLAMADPMKRFAAQVFGFDEHTLWGPSSARNSMDPRFYFDTAGESDAWKIAREIIYRGAIPSEWIAELMDWKRSNDSFVPAVEKLQKWFWLLQNLAKDQGGLSARTMLQTIGTEWGRYIDDRIWIRYAQRAQRKLVSGGWTYNRSTGLSPVGGAKYDLAVVTDGRFRNECIEFKAGGAFVLKVRNPETETLTAGVQGHASEMEQRTIPDFWYDLVVINDKRLGLEHLESEVGDIVDWKFRDALVWGE